MFLTVIHIFTLKQSLIVIVVINKQKNRNAKCSNEILRNHFTNSEPSIDCFPFSFC